MDREFTSEEKMTYNAIDITAVTLWMIAPMFCVMAGKELESVFMSIHSVAILILYFECMQRRGLLDTIKVIIIVSLTSIVISSTLYNITVLDLMRIQYLVVHILVNSILFVYVFGIREMWNRAVREALGYHSY